MQVCCSAVDTPAAARRDDKQNVHVPVHVQVHVPVHLQVHVHVHDTS